MIKNKLKTGILILIIALLNQSTSLAEQQKLQIYLPRYVAVSGETAFLKDVAVLKGDEARRLKAGEITLGKLTRPGVEITLDRSTLMSRLASNGIYSSDVAVTGADDVVIVRKGYVIRSEEFIRAAEQEIAKISKESSICGWKTAWIPKEFAVDGTGDDITLVAKILPKSSQSQIRATVSVMQKGKELCVREIGFNAQYKNLRAVAAIDIQQGTKIDSENVRIESYESAIGQQTFGQPYGLTAKHQIRAGTVINTEMLESTKSPILVNRNQGVVIQIKQPGLTITAMGQALEDGRARECVKVRNIDSQRVLAARVNDDGTVEPLY